MRRDRRPAPQGKVMSMKVVFKIEPTSARGKLYQVMKCWTDDEGHELRRPEVVGRPLSHDAAAAFCERCEKEHWFEN
jgi:hypothetical protein